MRAGPPPLKRLHELDGIRGIFMLGVAVYHTGLPFLGGSWVGVDVFFVLSGFLITTLLLEEHERHGQIDLSAFYARRALRLLPAMAFVLVAVVAVVLVGAVSSDAIETLPWVLAYAANWHAALGNELGPLSHLWSLALEEQFYVLWPLLLIGLLRWVPTEKRRIVVVGGVAAAIAATRTALVVAGTIDAPRAYFASDLRADALLIGCVLGLAHRAGYLAPLVDRYRRVVPLAVGFLVVFTLIPSTPYEGKGPLLFLPVDLAAAVVVGALVYRSEEMAWARVLRWRPLVHLGVLSYAFYLWHVPLMKLIDLTQWQQIYIALPLTYVAAEVSRHLVELPALRLKDRFRPAPSDRAAGQVEPAAVATPAVT